MSERYVKVFGCEENLYSENAPVIIRAGALLKDTETGRMIAQLKIQNVSGKIITYVKASITMLDSTKNQIGSFDAEYLDLYAPDLEIFGSKNAIVLPNASTRAFRVGIISVVFADDTVWSAEDLDWQHVEDSSEIVVHIKTEDIYSEAFALSQKTRTSDINRAIDLFKSIETKKAVGEDIARCEEMLKRAENEELSLIRSKKKRKRIIVIITTVIFVFALAIITVKVIIPETIWAYADKLVDDGKSVEAFEYVFEAYEAGWLPMNADGYYLRAIRELVLQGNAKEAISLYNRYNSLQFLTEYFHCPQNLLCSLTPLLTTTNLFIVCIVLPFPECHIVGIIHFQIA